MQVEKTGSAAFRKAVWSRYLLAQNLGHLSKECVSFDGTTVLSLKKLPLQLDHHFSFKYSKDVSAGISVRPPTTLNVSEILASNDHEHSQLLENCMNRLVHYCMELSEYPCVSGHVKKYLTERIPLADSTFQIEVLRGFSLSVMRLGKSFVVTHEVEHEVRAPTIAELLKRRAEDMVGTDVLFYPIYNPQCSMQLKEFRKKNIDEPLSDEIGAPSFREYYDDKFVQMTRKGSLNMRKQAGEWQQYVEQLPSVVNMIVAEGREGQEQFFFPALCRPKTIPEQAKAQLPKICGLRPADRISYTSKLKEHITSAFQNAAPPLAAMKEWGIDIDFHPISVEIAKTLPACRLQVPFRPSFIVVTCSPNLLCSGFRRHTECGCEAATPSGWQSHG